MKPVLWRFRFALCVVLLVLNACSPLSVKEPDADGIPIYAQRADQITAIHEWGFSGKISLDDGDQGGSGRLSWDVLSANSELDFHGAMGRGAWHLSIGPDGAVLKEANGNEQTSASVNDLISDRIGWPLPLDALQWWVRGLSAPGQVDSEQIDQSGLLTHLKQFGWSIEISRYKSFGAIDMPVRFAARRDNFRVKLAIGRWQMPGGISQ